VQFPRFAERSVYKVSAPDSASVLALFLRQILALHPGETFELFLAHRFGHAFRRALIDDFFFSLRLAANAASAAICCFRFPVMRAYNYWKSFYCRLRLNIQYSGSHVRPR
jgi:hypothetical protein